ncbi:MAG: hypothetical protein ABJF88_13475 [Rhodothermales bacterium]
MPAPPSRVTLCVDPTTARAYHDASQADRERAESAFALSLRGKREAAEELSRYMDEVGRAAQERGLTPELLDEMLSEDPPSDEK